MATCTCKVEPKPRQLTVRAAADEGFVVIGGNFRDGYEMELRFAGTLAQCLQYVGTKMGEASNG